MIIDSQKYEEIIKQLILRMITTFPDVGYTIMIDLWMDNTFQIICRNGRPSSNQDELIFRDFKWYNGEITFQEHTITKNNT